MNEIEILRGQLRRETQHVVRVARHWAQAARGEREAALQYLGWALPRFEDRDQRIATCLADSPPGAATVTALRAALASALKLPARSHEVLQQLEAATHAAPGESATAIRAVADLLAGPWRTRRSAIDQALGRTARVEDWRALAGIDADGILEERERFAAAGAPPDTGAGSDD